MNERNHSDSRPEKVYEDENQPGPRRTYARHPVFHRFLSGSLFPRRLYYETRARKKPDRFRVPTYFKGYYAVRVA